MSLALRRRADTVVSVVWTVVQEFRNRDIPFMAGSIAYYAFLSLFPLLMLVFLIVAFIGNEQLAAFVDSATETYLTTTAQSMLLETIREASGRFQLSVIAVITLLWGVTSVFRGLDTAFSKLYGTDGHQGIVEKTIDGLIVIGGIAVATSAMFVAGTVYALFPRFPFMNVLNLFLLTIALAIAFLPIYYVFPNVDVSVPEIIPGAVVAAIGWTLLQFFFQIYASYSARTELYGVLGGILLLVTWLYFGALVLLIGAATNVILSERSLEEPADEQEPISEEIHQ